MDTWHGDYGWQTYAMAGRPDLLNYLRHGDFKWPDLWNFFGARGLPDRDILARNFRLFHQFQSWQFDLEGGIPDPDGDIVRDLLCWGEFCLQHEDELPESVVRDGLVALVEAGSISPSYFECSFQCYLQALIARHSRNWPMIAESLPTVTDDGNTADNGALRVFIPEDDEDQPLATDPRWQQHKRAVARQTHRSWCSSYSGLMERLDEMIDDRPGL